MKTLKLFMAALIVAVVALAVTAIALADSSTCQITTITNDDVARQSEDTTPTKSWVLYTRPTSPGTGTFVTGPGQPPLGVGSLQLQTVSGSDKVYLFNFDYVGTSLADINKLGYSTYRTAGSNQQVAALNIQVDYNGPNASGGFTTLVFEPVYNPAQGLVTDNTWQTWDAFYNGNAVWWSTRDIPGVCASNCFVTWNQILAANPNATILGGIGINQGSGNPGLTDYVDAFSIGTGDSCVTYNFDPYRVVTNKDECKNGGYSKLKDANGNSFRNQGQCVSYIESNGKSGGRR
ncbi:MAG TPA: hypothetical protein VKB86_15160 [Pyrinomonadaceae bacterium]|nr:hypothetical protein [Pyrinomonadaceae bacterium]